MFALIVNGEVRELFSDRPVLHPDLVVVDVTDVVPAPAEGDLYDGAVFSQRPALSATEVAAALDRAAEVARVKYCATPLKSMEYRKAYDEASAWLLDQTQPVPPSTQCWAAAQGWTALEAANNITATGDVCNVKLDDIRAVRLQGHTDIMAGIKTLDQVLAELAAL